MDARTNRGSPPPSPRRPYSDADANNEEDYEEDETRFGDDIKRGTLYASYIICDGPVALKVLAWVLGEMEQTPVSHVPAHERDCLYVVRKDGQGGYEKVIHTPDHYKGQMPRPDTSKLYVLNELGHRYHGRVYRSMSKGGYLCVLKYFVKPQYVLDQNNNKGLEAGTEAQGLRRLGPTASFGKWDGGDAIVMPDLEKMSVDVNHHTSRYSRAAAQADDEGKILRTWSLEW